MSAEEQTPRRVVITGTGVAWGDATSGADLWDRSIGSDGVTSLLHELAGIPYVRANDDGIELERREQRRMSRLGMLAVMAARRACAHAGLDERGSRRFGVVCGSAGPGTFEHTIARSAMDAGDLDTLLAPKATASEAASSVARDRGFHGPAWTTGTACAAGNDAIATAVEWIRSGRCDAVVACGSESPLSEPVVVSMARLGVVATDGVCRPFDRSHHGFVFAEGAATLVVEAREHAIARGASVLCEVGDWASSCDAFHIVRPDPSGADVRWVIDECLSRSGLVAGDIGLYSAHGTGTPANDELEARLLELVLPKAMVSAGKGTFGHPFGASSCLEAIMAVECLQRGQLPPVAGLTDPIDGCHRPEFPRSVVDWEPAPVLSAAFGLGGVNTAITLLPSDWRP